MPSDNRGMHLNKLYLLFKLQCSCLSQSENTTLKVLSVKTEVMRVYEGRAMKT